MNNQVHPPGSSHCAEFYKNLSEWGPFDLTTWDKKYDDYKIQETTNTLRVTDDLVNHPKHYTSTGIRCSKCQTPVEVIQITETMNFTLGNAIKYIMRAGKKGDLIQDLQKARWYLDRAIESAKTKNEQPDLFSHLNGGSQ